MPRVYLDTTVPSAYLEARTPERQTMTRRFRREALPVYEPVISTLVLAEVRRTPRLDCRNDLERLLHGMVTLQFAEEAVQLARDYVPRGIVPEPYIADAYHIAIATCHGVEYLASWNFRHIVKVATRREINLANAILGYGPVEIVSPPEL